MKLSLLSLVSLAAVVAASSLACTRGPSPPTAIAAPASLRNAVVERAPPPIGGPERDRPDDHAGLERAAGDVFRGMHADLLRCFADRQKPRGDDHAFLTVEVLVDPDGAVDDVATTGGARLGSATLACIEGRVARASFRAHPRGGTWRIRVPLAFAMEPHTQRE